MSEFVVILAIIITTITLGLGLALSIAWWRGARALEAIERGVSALGEGRPYWSIPARVGGRVGRLARRLDAVAPRLEARIALLEQDRQQLRAVLGGMAEGVIAVDARRRLLFANAGADRLFGLDADSVGRLVPELIRSPQIQRAVETTLAGRTPASYQGEVVLSRRVARPALAITHQIEARVLAVHGTPLPGSPPPGAVLVFHDVTELRRLERMRRDFVANVSHELKTPLASIKAYTETLLGGALEDDAVNTLFLRRIEEQADRLNALILDLLSLARIESGQEVFRPRPLPLAPLVAARVESSRGRAEACGLNLTLDLGPLDDNTLIHADDEAVRQVLDNLIDNAIKYTPDGGTVHVACRLAGDTIALEVADTGIGIPRDDLPRVFERFYRVDRARSRDQGGTGLGLAIVKHLVQSLGGTVHVASRHGAGTTFTIHLPRHTTPSIALPGAIEG